MAGDVEFEFEPTGEGSQGVPAGQAPAGDPSQQQPQRQTPPEGQPPQGQAAGAAGAPAGGPQVPKGYVPQYRLNQVSDRLSQAMTQIAQLQQQLSAGAQPKPTVDPENQRILDQLFTVAPFLKTLADNESVVKQLIENAGVLPQAQQSIEHQWEMHGRAFLDDLRGEVRKMYGEDASPRALRQFEIGFIDWIEHDPEARQRYLAGDRQLVQEYWKEVTTHMHDPIRRRALADAQRRGDRIGRVPSPAPGTGALGKGGPPKPKTEEEVHDRAWDALQNARQ